MLKTMSLCSYRRHSDFSESADEFVESENFSETENESMIIGTPNDKKSFADMASPSASIVEPKDKGNSRVLSFLYCCCT